MGNSQDSTRTMCIPITSVGYVTSVLSIIPTLLVIIVLIYGLQHSKTLNQPLLKYIYWITTFLLFIAAIIWPLHLFFDLTISGYCNNWIRVATTSRIANVSWMLSLISICCLYTIRLHLSFRLSKLTLSNTTLICLAIMIFIQIILSIFVAYFGHSFWIAFAKLDKHNMDQNLSLFMIFYNTFGGFCMLYNIILLIIFLKKISQISGSLDGNEREQAIETLVEPAVNYTLCLFIAFISTLIVFSFGIMRGNVFSDSNIIYQAHVCYISWDIFINALSITMQFDAAKPMFDKYCKYCKNYLVKKFPQNIIIVNDLQDKSLIPLNSIPESERTQATAISSSPVVGVPKLNRVRD
eukprot:455162_1